MPEACYRALLYPGSLQRWRDGVYNSYHHGTHPKWDGIWNEKEAASPGAIHDAKDFPLGFSMGIYSEPARASYLQLMREKGGEGWTQPEIDSATELAGVSAFNGADGPARVYTYAAESGLPEDGSYIATFMGTVICSLPEDGGVVSEVVEPTPPLMTTAEFRIAHHLPQYVAPVPVEGESQPELPAQKDIFADLDLEEGPQVELNRDIPWKDDEEFGR
jgi:hypothetical protein